MKKLSKILSVVLVLAMIMGMAAVVSAESEQTATLVTDVNTISSGGSYVLVAAYGEKYYAMSNTVVQKPSAVEVTVDGNQVKASSLPVWTVESTGNGISLKSGSDYLAYNSSTNFKSSSTAYEYTLSSRNDGSFTVTCASTASASTVRAIAFQDNSGAYRFGPYGTSNDTTGSNYSFGIMFYKLDSEVGGGDDNTSGSEATPAVVESPVEGTAYKFGINQVSLSKTLYFTGEMSGYYLGTTENWDDAADVYIESVEGGLRLYFMNGTTKTYIDIVPRTDAAGKVNVVLSTAPSAVYSYNNDYHYYSAEVDGTAWYLGTFGTHNTISPSKTSFIEDTSKIGVSQFVASMYAMPTGESGSEGGEGGTGSEGGDTPSGETVSAGLLTSNEKLTDGAKVIIANVDGTKAMGAYFQSTNDDKNYRTVVDVTKDSNKVTGSGIAVLTVEVNDDGTYSLKAEDGYIAAAEKGNYLNTNASKDDLACWNISIYSDGTACIVTTGNAASPLLQYNGSGNSARFTGYKTSSGQQFVNIYLVNYEGDTPVAISATPKANIAEIRTTKVGDVASVKGVVTYVYYKYIYIQDDNATLKVCFTENATCSRGDVVSVSGIVYSDGSLINATATPSDGMTLTATDCAKIADLVNIDEGRYVKLSNLTVTEIKKNDKTEAITGYVLSDGTDTISVSLDGCEVELEVGAVVNVQTANTQLLTIVNASEIAVVTPGSGSGSTTTPEKPVETVKAPAVVASPVAGTAYKFGYYQANKDKTLWITGEMAGYYMATTDKWSEAADVYTETTNGGVYLYFMSGTTKTYINLVKNGNYTNFDLSATAATVYTYNTQYKYFSAKVGEDTVYLGTYKDYETMSASNVSYIEDASVIGKSQFLACMYEMTDVPAGSGSNPDTGDTTISLVVAALVVSALGMTAMVAKKKEF